MTLLRGPLATPPRTLVDVLRRTAADHPDEPAIDNGAQVLTYEEFLDAAEEVADELHAAGVGPGDQVGVRIRSGTTDLYVAIAGTLLRRCRLRAGRRRRPRRAGAHGVRRGRTSPPSSPTTSS